MNEMKMDLQFDMPKNRSNVIKVIGVGGGGSNAINYMFQQGITGVDFVVCNTDHQALDNSPVPTKVQLGIDLTEGLGAGANPEVGEQAALESFEDIKSLLDANTKMLFITAGMGGGTGTGAAPIIAKQAREMDILTVGIVTMPFKFEGKLRIEQAKEGIEKLRRNVDSLIVIDNNKLREIYGNLGFKSGFAKADEVLATAARGIAEVITHHYTQNIDLRDAKTVLSNSGTAIMGSAIASGESRAKEAITKALDSPLLNDNKINGAKNVLLLIVSGSKEITLDEIGEINDYIQEEAGHNANIIMGVGEDEELNESISVTIIATGFNPEQQNEIVNTEAKKIIHTLEDDQKATHNLSPKTVIVPEVNRPNLEVEIAVEEELEDASGKIVHNLEDWEDEDFEEEAEFEEEDPLIDTCEILKEIEVNYREMIFDKGEFVFIDSEDTVETPKQKVVVEEPEMDPINSPLFVFDMPKAKVETAAQSKSEEIRHELEPEAPKAEIRIEDDEVQHTLELFPGSSDEDNITRYSLDDYLEIERELNEAKADDYADIEPEPVPGPVLIKKEAAGEKAKIVAVAEPEVKTEIAEEEQPEVDPLTTPISRELVARAPLRRERLKKYNYRFRKSKNIDEMEKQPAYKRAGIMLEDETDYPISNMSRSTIEENEDGFHLRANNSFLHDNVD